MSKKVLGNWDFNNNDIINANIDSDNNTITNIGIGDFDVDTTDMFELMNAAALDSPAVTVTSNGTIILLNLEKNGTGDIRFIFSDGIHIHDCTPIDTISLTAGSDVSPQINYIYIPQATKVLTVSTSSFPAEEHAPIATVFCQSASSLQIDGAYKVHAWTDHVAGSDNQGHISHLNSWIRNQPATWESGVIMTPTGGASKLYVATSSGIVLQLHNHAYPAFDTSTGSDIYVVNDNTTAYKKVGNLSGETTDANGGSMTGDWYHLVIWGSVNEAEADCKIFCNLPTLSYNNNNGDQASNDIENTAIYSIPSNFTGTGFLIARLLISESGGTFTIQENVDLRGLFPSTSAGGGATGGAVEFADNVFRIQDNGDVTKQIAFEASSITTANTRTITVPDFDINLISKVGTPIDKEVAVWTGDGTLGRYSSFVYEDGSKTLNIFGLGSDGIRLDGTNRTIEFTTGIGTMILQSGGTTSKTLTLPNITGNLTVSVNGNSASSVGEITLASIVGLTGTKAQFNTELSDGSFLFVGDAPTSHTLLSHTISGETTGHVLAADSATTYSIRQLLGSEISNTESWAADQTDMTVISDTKANFDTACSDGNFMYIGDAPTTHTHLLAAGATDVTATVAEVNLLDLSGLTTGWVLSADSATTASWKAPTGGSTPSLSKSITIPDPVATDDATIFFTPVAITVTDVRSHITGTTNVVFNIGHASTRTGTQLDVFTADITLTSTAGQSNSSGFSDATIPANSWVWVDIVSVSGTPTMFHTTVIFTED